MWKLFVVFALAFMAKTTYSREMPAFASMMPVCAAKITELIKGNLQAAFQYLTMSTFQSRVDVDLKGYEMMYNGAARYKLKNAIKLMMYLTNRGGELSYEDIPILPTAKWANPAAGLMLALNTEEGLAKLMNELMKLAQAHEDPHTTFFMEEHILKGQTIAVMHMMRLFTMLKNGGAMSVPVTNRALQMIYANKTICY